MSRKEEIITFILSLIFASLISFLCIALIIVMYIVNDINLFERICCWMCVVIVLPFGISVPIIVGKSTFSKTNYL